MMGWRTKLRGGAEWDVFSNWRRLLCYLQHPGITKRIKRQHNKRIRREAKKIDYDE